MTEVIEVQTPEIQTRQFFTLDAALDYCRIFQPVDMAISKRFEIWELNYVRGEEE